jgi:hypothetical protein
VSFLVSLSLEFVMPRRSRARSAARFLARVYRVNLTPAFAQALLARVVSLAAYADLVDPRGTSPYCVTCAGGARVGNLCLDCVQDRGAVDVRAPGAAAVILSEACVRWLQRRAQRDAFRAIARDLEAAGWRQADVAWDRLDDAVACMAVSVPLPYEEYDGVRRWRRRG